jgi:HNH endonuclease
MANKLRNPMEDQPKSLSQQMAIFNNKINCKLIDCAEPISTFEGPGSNCLCRVHQLQTIEYGGLGKPERPHTFYRNWVCECCGYDAREDPLILSIEDPFEQLQAMRNVMHGDHIIRKSDGGADSAENIQALCLRCHAIKTIREKDFRKGSLLLDNK